MLILKRVRYFTDFMRDSVDNRIIGPGEYYFEDTDDGSLISCEHYWELKKERMEAEWDDSYYNSMESERDYKEKLKEAERQYLQKEILDRVKLQDLR